MISTPENSPSPIGPALTSIRRVLWVVTAVYLIALLIGTHLPGQPNLSFTWPDKFLHAGAYAGLAFLILSLRRCGTKSYSPWRTLCYLSVLAAVDELTQIPCLRTCDPFDWLADLVGLLLGAAACWAIPRRILPLFTKPALAAELQPD